MNSVGRWLRFSSFLFISLVATGFPARDARAERGPIEVTELFWNEMKKVAQVTDLEERKKVMAGLFNGHFDFERFYERALVDHWGGWNPDQREEFGSTCVP